MTAKVTKSFLASFLYKITSSNSLSSIKFDCFILLSQSRPGIYSLNFAKNFTGAEITLNPIRGEKLQDGLIRAKRLNSREAYKLYGKS